MHKSAIGVVLFLMVLGIFACAEGPEAEGEPVLRGQTAGVQDDQGAIEPGGMIPERESAEDEESASEDQFLKQAIEPWKDDLDGMVERRVIRALVTYNRTDYCLDGVEQKGVSYEVLISCSLCQGEKQQFYCPQSPVF